MRTSTRRRSMAAAALLAVVTVSSCGGDGERTVGDAIRDAVTEARERVEAETGVTRAEPSAEPTLDTRRNAEFDYADYQQTLTGSLGLLEEFWAATLPQLGGRYSSPSRYTYYRSDEGAGPACGGQAAPANNAFYCPDGDFIAWDESGLMIPYYVQGGDFAAAFVLAHEFGHAMQVRLRDKERLGLLRELQADCFAGAWARDVADRGLLEAGDLDEATLAVFIARDVPGTPFTDPRAHGTGFQRTRAFGDGVEAGAQACYPAPEDRWILEGTS